MDDEKSKRSRPILTRREIYLWFIFTSAAIFPSAFIVYLNLTTRVQVVVWFSVGLPLGAFAVFSIVRRINQHHDSRRMKRPLDPP